MTSTRDRPTPQTPRLEFGEPSLIWRAGDQGPSVRLRRRSVVTVGSLLLGCVLVALFAIATGEYPIAPGSVLATLAGHGDRTENLVVLQWRAPRILLALALGAALAISGAVFQTLTRNPLGSPDIIGFNTGAYTGALIAMAVAGTGFRYTAPGALAGGLATAAVIYLLSYRSGVTGFRLIIVGIGVAAMLSSANTYLILLARLDVAMIAAAWGAGTLSGANWVTAMPALIATCVLIPPTLAMSRILATLDLGDHRARSLGVRVETTRALLVLLGVALVAIATATAGPIAFVALVAPQLARRVAGGPAAPLAGSAAMGALLVLLGDTIATRAFAPIELPVGVVTVALGGLYLAWLLAREFTRS